MLDAAQLIADEIKRRAGGRLHINRVTHSPMLRLDWIYDCPCGEQSGYSTMLEATTQLKLDVGAYVHHHVEIALAVMRRHVRSEGNEPSF